MTAPAGIEVGRAACYNAGMKVVYIAGPYRAPTPWGVEQNIRRAEDVAVRVHKAGMMAMCPHANSRHMEGVADDAHFLAGTMELMRRCDAVLLVPGWENSSGTIAEMSEAERLRLPIFGRFDVDSGVYHLKKWAEQSSAL
jgi:nucleoside 2-deoxyribosyltransferase